MPSSRLCALAYLCVWSGDAPLYFYAVRDDLDQTRKMGLARGLVDFARFARSFTPPEHAMTDAAKDAVDAATARPCRSLIVATLSLPGTRARPLPPCRAFFCLPL
jgi:hypothetical protein